MDLAQALQLATDHYHAGRLADAEVVCRQILAANPNQPEALHLLGVIAQRTGHPDAAIQLIHQATQLRPHWAEAHNNLGNVYCDMGMLDAAVLSYRRAIRVMPDYPSVYHNLAYTLKDLGRLDDAADAARRAIALQPDFAEAHNGLGNILCALGKLDEALDSYQRAVQIKPDMADAHSNIGSVLNDKSQFAAAEIACRHAIHFNPNFAIAHTNLGNALDGLGRYAEAVASHERAIQLQPELLGTHTNLGNALMHLGRFEEAISANQRAIQLNPNFAVAHSNLGIAQKSVGRFDQAIASCRRAVELDPNYAQAHWNLGILLLAAGDFLEGWREYEWRLRNPALNLQNPFQESRWTGENLRGKTILLYAEGGFGDAIQYVRFAPMVAERGATVILQAQADLLPLFRAIPGVSAVYARGEPLPKFDFQSPLPSLPMILGTTLQTIPQKIPYLFTPPEKTAQWSARFENDPDFKIGLIWSGHGQTGELRSRSLALFAPLADIPGITFYSLQKGPESAQPVPPGFPLIHFGEDLKDFADTAAAMMHLDLIISVDTSTAHLAGALGRPVWTLIPADPDYRWLRDRSDSPWYPTMRLFRQKPGEDWAQVIPAMTEALRQKVAIRR
jgi:tetratricopeptide (TPR) repeat protein